jgi:hypothetical protein
MRFFSVEEANRMVPVLQHTFEKVRRWGEEIAALTEQLRGLGDHSPPGVPIAPDLPEGHRRLRRDRDRRVEKVKRAVQPLVELGVEVRRLDGVVDFRSRRAGRQVQLCWHFGEGAIAHWHELGQEGKARLPIQKESAFERPYLN